MVIGRGHERVDGCDVVVVGAGPVGAAIGARLAVRGLDTAVLEAQDTAREGPSHGVGLVLAGFAEGYERASTVHGRRKAQEVHALMVEGRERLVAEARRLGVAVSVGGSWALAVDREEAAMLERSAALLREDGFGARFEQREPLGRGFHGGLYTPGDAVVDERALTTALLTSEGLAVHGESEVYRWEPEGTGVRVWAQGRTVFCEALVLAVNGYAPLLSPYFTVPVSPVPGVLVTGGPLYGPVPEWPCTFDYGRGYCRRLPDHRLLLGFWQPTGGGERTARPEEVAGRHFPEVDWRTGDRRTVLGGVTPDGLPLVGRLPDLPSVYFAVGMGGRGLAWMFVVAERLAALLLDDVSPGLLAASRLGAEGEVQGG